MKALLATGVNEQLLRFDVQQLVGYVASTRSDDGGYCFYRLNESNAADTFYAVYVLTALNRPVKEPEKTMEFLQQRQRRDGSFQSIYLADYVLRGLDLLGVPPLLDPGSFLQSQLKGTLSIVSQPYYELSYSFLESLGRAVEILAFQHEEPSPALKTESLLRYVRTSIPMEDSALITRRSIRLTTRYRRSPSLPQTASQASPSGYDDASGRRGDSRRRP